MSALTSLLVRDDAVTVRQIEDALQRQVLDGGDLDTALLELGALPENVLIAYRAVSEQSLPVGREEVMLASATTRSLISADLAQRLRVTPIAHDSERVIVASHKQLTATEVAELRARTGLDVECRITSELRVHAALERFYGRAMPKRLAALLRRVDAQPAGELVEVEPLKVSPSGRAHSSELLPGFDESEDFESALESAFERVSSGPPQRGSSSSNPTFSSSGGGDSPTRPLGGRMSKLNVSMRRGVPTEQLGTLAADGGGDYTLPRGPAAPRATYAHGPAHLPAHSPFLSESPQPRSGSPMLPEPRKAPAPQTYSGPPARASEPPPPAAPVGPVGQGARAAAGRARPSVPAPPSPRQLVRLPQGPLSAVIAEQALATAQERDAVMEIFFRFARQYFDSTLLLSIKGERIRGVQAHNASALVDVRDISVPILRGGAIDDMVRSLVPRVSDLSRKDEDRVLAVAVKRLSAQPAALIPVCIKRRVVSLIYGDRSGEPLHLDELSELLGLSAHVTRAFERIIHTRKALGLSNGRSAAEFRERDLQHAPTQRSISLPPMPTQTVASALAEAALAAASAEDALAALGVASPAPPPPRDPLRGFDPDANATERMSIKPLPLDSFDAPPRYLSKPPPGTGRYRSVGPRDDEPTQVERSAPPAPAPASDSARARAQVGADETQPLRQSRRPSPRASAVPEGAASKPPASAASGARPAAPPPNAARPSAPPPANNRTSAPPVANSLAAAIGRASLHASKPAPGTGAYHSQGVTTEMISVPPGAATGSEAHALQSESQPAHDAEPAEVPNSSPAPANDTAAGARRRSAGVPETKAFDHRQRAEQLLSELCERKIDEELLGVQALHALGEPALALLLERFPGPLWFDRRRAHARVPFGRDVSPIARALDAFGDRALERLAPLLRSNEVEKRYYATLFACDRVHASLLEPLLERLFDDDPQIRLLVRDVLPHYRRLPGFARIAERLCTEARESSAPLRTRLAAIDAIAMLRDAASVPTLIDLLNNPDKQISVPAHRALTVITCQDFGKAVKKWRGWFESNAYRHRVEWLIEGLMHTDEALRAAAGLELQKLTQVYYGYVAAASKRDREQAQKRYWDWWRGEGRQKF